VTPPPSPLSQKSTPPRLGVTLDEDRKCFIANSVTFPITCEPTVATEDPA
jgi:hypothetical protein